MRLITVMFAIPDDDPAYRIRTLVGEIQEALYDEGGMSGEFRVTDVLSLPPEVQHPALAQHVAGSVTKAMDEDTADLAAQGSTTTAEEKPKPIGFQVDDYDTGEHWDERPSFQILSYETAMSDLRAAHEAGEFRFRLSPIYAGDIEEPCFEQDADVS